MQGAPNKAHGGICLWSQTIHEKRVGQCSDGACSPNKSSCGGLDFLDSQQSTENCDVDSTLFGRCGDRCSWSPDNCSAGEEWTFPSQGCNCDQVQVGACEKDGFIFCSVSPDSCDDKATWLSPVDVASTTPYQCYLCREKIVPVAPPVAAPVAAPVDNNKPSSEDSIIAVDNVKPSPAGSNPVGGYNPSASSRGSKTNTGVVVGAVVGGVGGAVMVLVLFMFVRKRQDRNSRDVVNAPLPFVDVS